MFDYWIDNDSYFDDLAVFGLGFFHPGGMSRTKEICESRDWTGIRVLDVGCGIGTTMKMLSIYGAEAYGLDKSKYMLRGAELNGVPKSNLFCCDVSKIKTDEQKYDVILLEGVIGFIEQPVALVNKLTRLLSPNGEIVISDWEPHERPNNSSDKNYGFTIYAKTKLNELAQSLSCTPDEVRSRVEQDTAKSFNLTVEQSVARVQAFFNVDRLEQNHISSIERKIKKMESALNETVDCKSYIIVLSESELNKKIQEDTAKLHR